MRVLCATSVAHATAALAEDPGATVLAGGTDVMVDVNSGRRTPTSVISVGQIPELRGTTYEPAISSVRCGAATTFTEIIGSRAAARIPALVEALRSVGSRQIRNAATLGGSVGTGSPKGDPLPVLVALDASVELVSQHGTRVVPVEEFFVGDQRTARRPDELITAVHLPVLEGRQHFVRVGPRSAMTIATCSAAIVVDRERRSVRLALGSVAPTVVRAADAEAWLADRVDWAAWRLTDAADGAPTRRFGELARQACRTVDDHRSTAEYRRYAVGILASRLARRAFE